MSLEKSQNKEVNNVHNALLVQHPENYHSNTGSQSWKLIPTN